MAIPSSSEYRISRKKNEVFQAVVFILLRIIFNRTLIGIEHLYVDIFINKLEIVTSCHDSNQR